MLWGWFRDDKVVEKCALATWRKTDVTKPPWGTENQLDFIEALVVVRQIYCTCANAPVFWEMRRVRVGVDGFECGGFCEA